MTITQLIFEIMMTGIVLWIFYLAGYACGRRKYIRDLIKIADYEEILAAEAALRSMIPEQREAFLEFYRNEMKPEAD